MTFCQLLCIFFVNFTILLINGSESKDNLEVAVYQTHYENEVVYLNAFMRNDKKLQDFKPYDKSIDECTGDNIKHKMICFIGYEGIAKHMESETSYNDSRKSIWSSNLTCNCYGNRFELYREKYVNKFFLPFNNDTVIQNPNFPIYTLFQPKHYRISFSSISYYNDMVFLYGCPDYYKNLNFATMKNYKRISNEDTVGVHIGSFKPIWLTFFLPEMGSEGFIFCGKIVNKNTPTISFGHVLVNKMDQRNSLIKNIYPKASNKTCNYAIELSYVTFYYSYPIEKKTEIKLDDKIKQKTNKYYKGEIYTFNASEIISSNSSNLDVLQPFCVENFENNYESVEKSFMYNSLLVKDLWKKRQYLKVDKAFHNIKNRVFCPLNLKPTYYFDLDKPRAQPIDPVMFDFNVKDSNSYKRTHIIFSNNSIESYRMYACYAKHMSKINLNRGNFWSWYSFYYLPSNDITLVLPSKIINNPIDIYTEDDYYILKYTKLNSVKIFNGKKLLKISKSAVQLNSSKELRSYLIESGVTVRRKYVTWIKINFYTERVFKMLPTSINSTTNEYKTVKNVTTAMENTTIGRTLVKKEATTIDIVTTTEKPKTTKIVTTTEEPKTTKIVTTTEKPKTTKIVTTTKEPTTIKIVKTTEKITTTIKPTTIKIVTTTEKITTTKKPTTTKESTTTTVKSTTTTSTIPPVIVGPPTEKPTIIRQQVVENKNSNLFIWVTIPIFFLFFIGLVSTIVYQIIKRKKNMN
uniref:CUB domain-containing protein n=1 Tax=Strongyloides stercoralis TaxID=6248 RepID=A0AAF5CRZ3_STRER